MNFERIEEYYFEKIPAAIWKIICNIVWFFCIGPFIAIGYAANKIWCGLRVGWFISDNFDEI